MKEEKEKNEHENPAIRGMNRDLNLLSRCWCVKLSSRPFL